MLTKSKKMTLLILPIALIACLPSNVYCGTIQPVEEEGHLEKSLSSISEDDDLDICPEINPKYPIYLPHPTDCKKFYICANGSPYLKTCQHGLHFNTKLKACDYPERAGCDKDAGEEPKGRVNEDDDLDSCPIRNSKYPVLLPHPTNCNKFYICDNGFPHLTECQTGLHFNPKLKSCDFPQQAGCDKAIAKKPKGKMLEDEDEYECPAENSKFPVYLPHPFDCNKFYICDNGVPHPKQCQPGLHFNPKLNACDYPKNAGCDKAITKKPKGKMLEDEDEYECPAENSKFPVYLPHPFDCNKFYICDNGVPHPKQCQLGLHFNPKLNACDYPKNAGCDKAVTKKPKGKMLEDEDKDEYECPAESSKFPVYLPHPFDCNKFYICDNGVPHPKQCQFGLHFNPKLNACDYPKNAGCDKEQTNALHEEILFRGPGVQSPFCPSKDGKTTIFFRSLTNCSVYYMCGNGFAYEFACPAKLHFNLRKKICDYEWNANCRI